MYHPRRPSSSSPKIQINKVNFLIVGSAFIAAILIMRLFQLQVLAHSKYQEIATREQYGYIELPAQRGEVIIKDYHSDEEFLLATNTTLNLLFADPAILKDPGYVADQLAPLLFDLEEEREKDDERISELAKNLSPELTEEDVNELLKKPSDQELEEQFRQELREKISTRQRTEILLATDMPANTLRAVQSTALTGIEIIDDNIYAYPPQISNPTRTAELLAEHIEIPSKKLAKILLGENRYVVLKRKLDPEISNQIKAMINNDEDEIYRGLGMQEEFFRFYPEGTLGSNLVGYVSHDNVGQYGIESSFHQELAGEAGKFQTKRDSIGRQITVGDSLLEPAVDGDDIVLTIDRSVQMKVEQILAAAVDEYQADSGQVVIQDPNTGAIIAMAHYPTFNPNEFGQVFTRVEVEYTEEELENLYPSGREGIYYYYTNPVTLDRYEVFEVTDENGNTSLYRYENFVGPEVYHNKAVSWPYEPGSVFKTVAMAIGIDDGDITPNTTFNDEGPIGVDKNVYTGEFDFFIKNAEGYFGLVNMQTVLAESLNTGMTFISKKIGPALFYDYIDKFGFLDRTEIEFNTEVTGKIDYFEDWTESELATHSFGQGITVTMVQMVNAYSAIVNGGILMQPYIVSEVRHDNGNVSVNDPHEIRRVISEETSDTMTAMLVNAVENGVAENGQVPGHLVGGKTGTSQTYKRGEALTGKGTTITSFAGFGPVDDPQFVVLIKFDRPKTVEWGSATAAPTFSKIAEYLFNYYNIPPDKADTARF